ncbi:MAG: hypothetical protein JWM76_395 [Pseudonocardiales bacterium]|nr:hypothetical protein [Pseudonocardiales bacterium]
MPKPIFGTAHLFGVLDSEQSVTMLNAALDAGFTAFDTAPSYGFGDSEPAVGDLLRRRAPAAAITITTKVGITAGARPSRLKAGVKSVARRLPAPVQDRLRGHDRPAGHGNFGASAVRDSVDESLRRLPHVDRLVLHEVSPADITDELLQVLATYISRGDVGQVGVATSNNLTPACVELAPELFRVAHVSGRPLADPVNLPASVTTRVGHGLLGPAAADLKRLQELLDADSELAQEWRAITDASPWSGPSGLADALLSRASSIGLTDVIVATGNPFRLRAMFDVISTDARPPSAVTDVLDRLVDKAPMA